MKENNSLDVAASVRQRLLNIIRKKGIDANLVWTRFATERLLYRISVSEYAGEFVLKGALLFIAWTGQSYRPTVDLDLLGHGVDSSNRLVKAFSAICSTSVASDGILYDIDSIRAAPIRGKHEYRGQRVTLTAYLGKVRIPIQVDIGFGDVIIPRAKKILYPTLLDQPAPRICAYPRETVVAEKLQAIVMLDIVNSRMKDFYDLYILAKEFEFEGSILSHAIAATFKRRKTKVPTKTPVAISNEFAHDATKLTQWKAFLIKSGFDDNSPSLYQVISSLRRFLSPPLHAASGNSTIPGSWRNGGPWKD